MTRIAIALCLTLLPQIARADMTSREAVTAAQWMRQIGQHVPDRQLQHHHRGRR